MNRITTVATSDVTKTSIILYGKLEEKDHPVFGVGFCVMEGTTVEPLAGFCPPTGLLGGDVPICKFGCTVIDLKSNTKYRYRALSYDRNSEKFTYLITMPFPGCVIVDDERGFATDQQVPAALAYNALTKHLLINGVMDINCSVNGIITVLVPPEMGGVDSASVTFKINVDKLPKADITADITITKIPGEMFYGVTKNFTTKR